MPSPIPYITQRPPFLAGVDRLNSTLAQIRQERMERDRMAQQQQQFDQRLGADDAFRQAQLARQRAADEASAEHQRALREQAQRESDLNATKFAAEGVDAATSAAFTDPTRLKAMLPGLALRGVQIEPGELPNVVMPRALPDAPNLQLQEPGAQSAVRQALGGQGQAPAAPGLDAPQLQQPEAELPSDLARIEGAGPDEIQRALERLRFKYRGQSLASLDLGDIERGKRQRVQSAMAPYLNFAQSPAELAIRQAALEAALAESRFTEPDKASEKAHERGQSQIEEMGRNTRSMRAALAQADRTGGVQDRLIAEQAWNHMDKIAVRLNTDGLVGAYQDMQKGLKALEENPDSPSTWSTVRTVFSRASGERGAVTEGDVARAGGIDSQSIDVRIKQAWKQATEGGVAPEIREDVLSTARVYLDVMNRKAKQHYDLLRKQQSYYGPDGPLSHSTALAMTNQYIESMFGSFPWGMAASDRDRPNMRPGSMGPSGGGGGRSASASVSGQDDAAAKARELLDRATQPRGELRAGDGPEPSLDDFFEAIE